MPELAKGCDLDRDIFYTNLPRLAAAILLQACIDARDGDLEAITFLVQDAPIWLDSLGLGYVTPNRIRAMLNKKHIGALAKYKLTYNLEGV